MFKLFNDKGFWKTVLRLALPVAMQSLLTSSFTLVDTLLVSNLGTVALSSVGMIGQWVWLMNMIMIGFCSATTVFVSQFWGIKDIKSIKHIDGISTLFAFTISIMFTAVSLIMPNAIMHMFNKNMQVISVGAEYLRVVSFSFLPIALTNILSSVLRSVERVKLPMYISGFTTVLNIFLDYAMIFGKFGFSKMGVRGAALATAISSWLGLILLIAISVVQKNVLIGRLKDYFVFSKEELVEYIKRATPVVINEGMWGLGTFIFTIIFANMGYEYFSALTILRSFENMSFVIFIGICSAASVMIGKSVGKGNIERGLYDSKRFMIIVPCLAVVVSLFIAIFRNNLVGIFNMGNNVSDFTLKYAAILMIIYAVAFPLRMLPYLEIVAIFRAGGDTITGAKLELCSLWAFSIPATAIAVYLFKVPFAVAFIVMYVFEDIPKNILSLKFYLSKKWLKPVTEEGKQALETTMTREGEQLE